MVTMTDISTTRAEVNISNHHHLTLMMTSAKVIEMSMSSQIVLLRTTLTWKITLHQLMIQLLDSNQLHCCKRYHEFIPFWEHMTSYVASSPFSGILSSSNKPDDTARRPSFSSPSLCNSHMLLTWEELL